MLSRLGLRNHVVVVILVGGFAPAASCPAAQATLDDLSLPGEGYYNGSDQAGVFFSGGVAFDNYYDTTFGSWSGFAYSNVTDTTTPGFGNQYSAFAGGGGGGSANYGVAFLSSFDPQPRITFPTPSPITSIEITNTTYTALAMLQGDAFAKRFGGASGDDPDYLLLTVEGRDADGGVTATVGFYLADYRFEDNRLDYVVDSWQTVDLSPLGGTVQALTFQLETTDVGMFGPNTPFYFAVDNITYFPPPPPDFNGDGHLDCGDIDLLVGAIAAATHDPAFDLNGDGFVDLLDRDAWLRDAGNVNLPAGGSYPLGDANLDGVVDVSDFNAWNTHKSTAAPAWCRGDFTADGFVDVSDFNVWNSHRFSTSAGGGPAAVPEPGALILAVCAIVSALRCTKTGTRPGSTFRGAATTDRT